MSYDGMYSDLSTRGTTNQILTQALDIQTQILLSEDNVEALAAQALNSASAAANSEVIAATSASTASAAATSASSSSNSANTSAAEAAQSALDALTNSAAALIIANDADDKADAAVATANGIAGTANTALANSITAVDTANTANTNANAAVVTANGIADTANTALSNSVTAINTSNTANTNANTAVTTANAAVVTANAAQPGDATLTALAELTTAANQMIYSTGANTFAMTALSTFIRTLLDDADSAASRVTLGVQNAGTSGISGLVPSWTGAQIIVCSGGSAYVPGLSKTVTIPSATTFSFTPTNNTWYFIYLTEITGTPTLEISTTPCATIYEGTARTKDGDTSRRFISTIRSGPGGFRPFLWTEDYLTYLDTLGTVVSVNAATDIGPTAVSLQAVVPITTRRCQMQVYSAAGNSVQIGVAFDMFYLSMAPGTRGVFPMITTTDQVIVYKHTNTVTGGTTIDIRSYGTER